jgi:CheY-like chemotaxis protein
VAFAVRDTGIGIPADKQAIIFEPFQQVDMATSRKFGGTGLGLSISRELVHLLGGELTVQSTPEEGSTFTLYLPLVYRPARSLEHSLWRAARSEPPAPAEVVQAPGIGGSTAAPAEGNTGHDGHRPRPVASGRTWASPTEWPPPTDSTLVGKKVLIVDDDMRNIFALTSALERHGMEVAFAETGQEGINLLASRPDIDVVLMDIMLPEMDGYETMRRIRALPGHAAQPLIALTAKAMSGDREKCLEAGASDYISKPVDVGQLLALLRMWLERAGAQ